MALEPVRFTVNGFEYSCIPHTGKQALNLNRIVTGLWTKLMGNVSAKFGSHEEQTERLQKFSEAFSALFLEMDEDKYISLVEKTFANTVYIGKDKEPNIPLRDADVVGDHFADHKSDTELVMLEIWSANKFAPFE